MFISLFYSQIDHRFYFNRKNTLLSYLHFKKINSNHLKKRLLLNKSKKREIKNRFSNRMLGGPISRINDDILIIIITLVDFRMNETT